MLDSLEAIAQNNYVNRFKEIAKNYGLDGEYISYRSSSSGAQDIYFVCGLDSERINSENLNIDSIVELNKKMYSMFNPHIAAFKLTGNDAFMCHQKVVDYCQKTEFVRAIYNDYQVELPSLVPMVTLMGLKVQHRNATNPAFNPVTQSSYRKAIRSTLQNQKDLFDPNSPKHKILKFYMYDHYDTQKSKLHNWLKRTFSRDKNKVSMEHLLLTCNELSKIEVCPSDAKKIQAELRKHPEIIYWKSKTMGKILELNDDQGYGSRENNDQRYIVFAFDREYNMDINAIMNKLECPEAYKTTPEELSSQYKYVHHLSIPRSDYEKFAKACKKQMVAHCIKDSSPNQEVVSIVAASNSERVIPEILEQISAEAENSHLFVSIKDREQEAAISFHENRKEEAEEAVSEQISSVLSQYSASPDIELISSSGDIFSQEPVSAR